MPKVKVRHATPADLSWILGEFEAFSNSYGTKKPLFGDKEYAKATMLNCMEKHLVFVAESEKGLMGLISGYVVPHPYNPQIKLLAEMFWWVPEIYRRTRAGLMLLDAFTAWGREHCDWITFATMDSTDVNSKTLARRGYVPMERAFLLEVT